MNIPFDKVYILTTPSFKERFTFVHKQLNDLGIEHNFIWGTDLGKFKNDSLGYKIHWPQLWEYETTCTGRDVGCTLSHYDAVYQSYEFGFNKILIMEDDVCFNKNKDLIETLFNNIPEDADFVTYDPRFWFDKDFIQFHNDINNDNLYIKDHKQYQFMFGSMMYAIMNRNTMELYLNNQRKNLFISDHVQGLFCNVSVNKYISSKCICTDQFNIKNNFNIKDIKSNYKAYLCNYDNLNINDFYTSDKYNEFIRTC